MRKTRQPLLSPFFLSAVAHIHARACLPTGTSSSHTTHTHTYTTTMPWESAPPFALIVAMVGGMAGIQAGVHKLFHGKPKAVGLDAWDRAATARDERVTAEGASVGGAR